MEANYLFMAIFTVSWQRAQQFRECVVGIPSNFFHPDSCFALVYQSFCSHTRTDRLEHDEIAKKNLEGIRMGWRYIACSAFITTTRSLLNFWNVSDTVFNAITKGFILWDKNILKSLRSWRSVIEYWERLLIRVLEFVSWSREYMMY